MKNVLLVCNYGRNRSRHLAGYLESKGYATQFAGVSDYTDNKVSQEMVDWADVIVCVKPEIAQRFKEMFTYDTKRLIELDVEDRVAVLAPDNPNISGDEWVALQNNAVYPSLEEQINEHLPL